MKTNYSLFNLLFCVVLGLFMVSCSSGLITKRKHRKGYHWETVFKGGKERRKIPQVSAAQLEKGIERKDCKASSSAEDVTNSIVCQKAKSEVESNFTVPQTRELNAGSPVIYSESLAMSEMKQDIGVNGKRLSKHSVEKPQTKKEERSEVSEDKDNRWKKYALIGLVAFLAILFALIIGFSSEIFGLTFLILGITLLAVLLLNAIAFILGVKRGEEDGRRKYPYYFFLGVGAICLVADLLALTIALVKGFATAIAFLFWSPSINPSF